MFSIIAVFSMICMIAETLACPVGPGTGRGRTPCPARPAAVLGRGVVGEDAFGVPDRLADRLVGKIAPGPDTADQPLRHLAGVDREIVHELRFLRELLHDLVALGADRVDREAEGESDRVVGDGFQKRDHLARVDEGEGPGEDVDPAAPGACARQLEIGDIGRFLRKARPDIAEAVIARRLAFEGGRPGDVRRAAHVVHEAVHAAADVCRYGGRYRGRDHRPGGEHERGISDPNSHVRLPSR